MTMQHWLAFDTSTEVLSIGVSAKGHTEVRTLVGGAQSSSSLIPTAMEMLAQAGIGLAQLDAIVFDACIAGNTDVALEYADVADPVLDPEPTVGYLSNDLVDIASALSHGLKEELEGLSNEAIRSDYEVTSTEMPLAQAKVLGAQAMFGDRGADRGAAAIPLNQRGQRRSRRPFPGCGARSTRAGRGHPMAPANRKVSWHCATRSGPSTGSSPARRCPSTAMPTETGSAIS